MCSQGRRASEGGGRDEGWERDARSVLRISALWSAQTARAQCPTSAAAPHGNVNLRDSLRNCPRVGVVAVLVVERHRRQDVLLARAEIRKECIPSVARAAERSGCVDADLLAQRVVGALVGIVAGGYV